MKIVSFIRIIDYQLLISLTPLLSDKHSYPTLKNNRSYQKQPNVFFTRFPLYDNRSDSHN